MFDNTNIFGRMRPSQRGWLAQLGEHRPYKARVTGSIPVPPTIFYRTYRHSVVRSSHTDR